MDDERMLKLLDKALEALERPIGLRSRGFQIGWALHLMAVIALALVDIAESLRKGLASES